MKKEEIEREEGRGNRIRRRIKGNEIEIGIRK